MLAIYKTIDFIDKRYIIYAPNQRSVAPVHPLVYQAMKKIFGEVNFI